MKSKNVEKRSIDAMAALAKDQAITTASMSLVMARSRHASRRSHCWTRPNQLGAAEGQHARTCLAAPGIDVCFRHQGESRVLIKAHKVVAATKRATTASPRSQGLHVSGICTGCAPVLLTTTESWTRPVGCCTSGSERNGFSVYSRDTCSPSQP